jgi:hypothetical protein
MTIPENSRAEVCLPEDNPVAGRASASLRPQLLRRSARDSMLFACTYFFAVFWPTILGAAVIRGNVVESQTSKPLARAMVTLQPIQGTPGGTQAMRTDSYGAFAFSPLSAGAYVVRVSKAGFLPTEYGQKRWNAAGTPIALTADGAVFVTIRLPRYGAITGTVVDENNVGLGQHRVLAYRDSQPPLLFTSAIRTAASIA